MLINACISEGINTGPRILDALALLGFDRKHAGLLLKGGIQQMPEWPNWGRREDGVYHVPP
jgi:hypothetical protein